MALKVGLTGGIGSGKSTVAKVFELLRIPVYYADLAAKQLMNEDLKLREKLLQTFGNDTYTNGVLNRPYLSSLVFNHPEKLALLNSIVHPATIAHSDHWLRQQQAPYAIKEAAIIFESKANVYLDKIIGVYAPAPLRIQRVMQRDGSTAATIEARMAQQMEEDKKMQLCDYVIINDEQQLVLPQVLKIHETIMASLS